MEKAVVLLSGGADSATLLSWATKRYEVAALTFDYGSKHGEREQRAAKEIAQRLNVPHRIIKLPFVGDLFKSDLLKSGGDVPEGHYEDALTRRTVVPFRNGIMLSIAVGYAESLGAKIVLYAAHAGDHAVYPDCRPEFLSAIAKAGRVGTYLGVEIGDPFVQMTKKEIVTLGKELGVPFEITYSCYRGGEVHCGRCATCIERKEAFQLAGDSDPTRYEA